MCIFEWLPDNPCNYAHNLNEIVGYAVTTLHILQFSVYLLEAPLYVLDKKSAETRLKKH